MLRLTVYKLPGTLLLITLLLITSIPSKTAVLSADTPPPQLKTGFGAGYSSLMGYYENDLNNSAYLSFYTIPYSSRYFFAEADVTFSAYELSGSQGSNLYSTAINMGPLLRLPLFNLFSLYAGVLARGNYLYLKASNLNREENTLKPGFSLRGGIMAQLPGGLDARAGIDYSQVWLSGEPFKSLNFYAGVSYNVLHLSSAEHVQRQHDFRALTTYAEIEKHYGLGLEYFNEGEIKSARKEFSKVLDLKKDHHEAGSYMQKISLIEVDYSKAVDQLEKGNPFGAIPHLVKTEKNMKEARSLLGEVRTKLLPLVPDYERRGIAAYDAGNYDHCIDLMGKIQLISPENRSAGIYLPRAVKRRDALKKLR